MPMFLRRCGGIGRRAGLKIHGYAREVQRRCRFVAVFNAPFPASRVLVENCLFFADVSSNFTLQIESEITS